MRRDAERLRSIAGAEAGSRYDSLVRTVRATLRGHTVWQINATAEGGGVAELLRSCLGYLADRRHRHPLARHRRRSRVLRHHEADPQPAPRGTRRRRTLGAGGTRALRRGRRGRTCARSSPWWLAAMSWSCTILSRSGWYPAWLPPVRPWCGPATWGSTCPNAIARSAWDFLRDDVARGACRHLHPARLRLAWARRGPRPRDPAMHRSMRPARTSRSIQSMSSRSSGRRACWTIVQLVRRRSSARTARPTRSRSRPRLPRCARRLPTPRSWCRCRDGMP